VCRREESLRRKEVDYYMATYKRTISIDESFKKHSDDEIRHFLKRGKYDVEYRKARNSRLTAERKEYQEWKKSRS
jgi:hypothetical protein